MAFPGYKRLGVDETATSTVQEHELGAISFTNLGQRYRYVKAGEAIAAYQPVDWTSAYVASVTDNGDQIHAVAQTAIASGSYGWVLEQGMGVLLMTASQVACDIGQVSAVGGLGNIAAAATVGDGTRGVSYATEAGTPAGVAVFLF